MFRLPFARYRSSDRLLSTFTTLLLLVVTAWLVCSCSTSVKKVKKFRIGFSQCQGDVWRQTMLNEMKRELSFHNDIEFIYRDAEANSNKQVQQIDELVNDNIDLLLVSPNEAAPLTAVIEKVHNAGIPVVLIDRGINSDKYTAFVGASNFEVGQNAARYTTSLLKGAGDILEVSGVNTATPFIERHRGFTDIISKVPGIRLVKTIQDHAADYVADLQNTLVQEKNIQLIFAHSDYIARDVFSICKKIGLDDKVKIIGVDGLPNDSLGMGMVEKKILTATVLYPTGGQEAIITAVKILEHKPFEKQNTLATTIIDSNNVRIMRLQHEKAIAQQDDIDKRQKIIEEQIALTRNQTNIILAVSVTLALALIFGAVLYYYLQENRKINKKLEQQKEEISSQRNQLIELMAKVKEATDAKFNFFTNISHELRTPLTLMMAPLDDMLHSPKLHFTVKNNLELIQRNTNRLLRLINQLMDFRKIEEQKMKLHVSENNLGSFVLEITDAFKEVARKKNISFNTLIKTKDLMVWFDVTMLDKVLFNLLSNAFKFTDEHGSIDVTVSATADAAKAIIKIEDSGIGMSNEDTDHAFEVFYQGHSSTFKGTGLGLSLSKELINLHHGEITVESQKGKGTCFEISLPISKEHFAKEEFTDVKNDKLPVDDAAIYTTDVLPVNMQTESEAVLEKEYSILLVEDNDDLLQFLKQRLSNKYDVHIADNGEKGINIAFDIVPDLIISDIILPNQSGLQLTEKLKQDIRTSHIPIILLTAKSTIEEQIEGIRSQADVFIVKPFNLEYLEENIKTLLKNRAVLREHYTSELPTENRSNASNKLDRKFINQFTAVIENNLSNEDFSVDDICKEIGISRVQLYRKVKALLGYNVNDYLANARLQKAKHLLTTENNTISEIAFKVGFASQAYFATVFKAKFGCTPTEFRTQKLK